MRDVIIACDFADQEKLFEFLKPFEGLNPYLKLGMEIIYKEGPQLVTKLHNMGKFFHFPIIPFLRSISINSGTAFSSLLRESSLASSKIGAETVLIFLPIGER